MENQALSREAASVFRRGSRTFSLAALFFDRATYEAASRLYAWCRYCDDLVDEQGGGLDAVKELEESVLHSFRGEAPAEPAFQALQEVAREHNIPIGYALDLVEGMAMDARGERYETLADLEKYAYHVAGTVGLMMSRILGADSPEAAACAKHLGIAMQLTNISRDILEDAAMGRVYLPREWLREEGLAEDFLADPAARLQLARLAGRLVKAAEPHYAKGAEGFSFLRFRHAVAIAAAAGIYRAIGLLVVRRGAWAWERRAVVSRARKIWEICLAPGRAAGWVRLS